MTGPAGSLASWRIVLDALALATLVAVGAAAALLAQEAAPAAETVAAAAVATAGLIGLVVLKGRARGRPGVACLLASDAATAGAALMGVVAVRQGLAVPELVALSVLTAAGAGTTAFALARGVDVYGPKHTFDVAVLVLALPLTLMALEPFLGLGGRVLLVMGVVLGAAAATAWMSQRAWRDTEGTSGPLPAAMPGGAVLGGLAWMIVASVDATRASAFAVVATQAVAAFVLTRGAGDPTGRPHTPLGPYLPWRHGDGRPRAWPSYAWARWPGHAIYVAGTTVLFFQIPRDSRTLVREYGDFVYQVPALVEEFPAVLLQLFTNVWFNYHPIQFVYVLVLLALFGVWFEVREGTWRAIVVFLGTSLVAGIVAGGILHVLRATVEVAWVEDAWGRAWAGGSAGAFGLMGAMAARAPRPWLLLAAFAFWELNVEIWFLRSYTVVFHATALVAGFLMARYALPPRQT